LIHITAGTFRSRKLNIPDVDGLRPTSSRVREALFNILGDIEGWRVLDLFSGSGLMALESLSRGASSVVSMEQHQQACQSMRQVSQQFDVQSSWHIQKAVLPKALHGLQGETFDWVFADPPYNCGLAEQISVWLTKENIQWKQLVIEESVRAKPQWAQNINVKTRRYGDTNLHFLTHKE